LTYGKIGSSLIHFIYNSSTIVSVQQEAVSTRLPGGGFLFFLPGGEKSVFLSVAEKNDQSHETASVR
jgi:hypothetical protein